LPLFEVNLALDEEDEFPEELVDEVFPDQVPEPTTVAEEAAGKVSAEAIQKCVAEMKALFDDGFQISDILNGLGLGMQILDLVKTMTNQEKEAAVVGAFKEAYQKAYDEGKIDLIKLVPNWIERKAIFYILDNWAPALVKWGCDLTNGKFKINLFNKEESGEAA
jgi:hypothetical protein